MTLLRLGYLVHSLNSRTMTLPTETAFSRPSYVTVAMTNPTKYLHSADHQRSSTSHGFLPGIVNMYGY